MSPSNTPNGTHPFAKITRDEHEVPEPASVTSAQSIAYPDDEDPAVLARDPELAEATRALLAFSQTAAARYHSGYDWHPRYYVDNAELLATAGIPESQRNAPGAPPTTGSSHPSGRSALAWEWKRNNHTQGVHVPVQGLLSSSTTKDLPTPEIRSKAAFKIRMTIGCDGVPRRSKWMTWAEALAFEDAEREKGAFDDFDFEGENDYLEQDEEVATTPSNKRQSEPIAIVTTRSTKRRRGGG